MLRALPLVLWALASPALASGKDWIGRVVPAYPDGLRSNLGACVGDGSEPDRICAYNIATLDDAKGHAVFLYAGREAPNAGAEPRWTITDVIPYPRLQRHEYLSLATCERGGKSDAAIVAVVDTRGAEEMYDTVRWAVRLQQGRFVEVPVAGIRCYNEGYGE